MQIIDLVSIDFIKLPLAAKTRDEAIDEMVKLLAANHDIGADDDLAERIKSRELKVSSDHFPGIACPHRESKTARGKCMVIGKFNNPIQWSNNHDWQVSLVFLYTLPETDVQEFLLIMEALTVILRPEVVRSRLLKAKTAKNIYDILSDVGTNFDVPVGFELKKVLCGHSSMIHSLSWSPNGDYLAAGVAGPDPPRVWSIKSDKVDAFLQGHRGPIFAIKWSPDGKHVATGSSDKIIRIWDTENSYRLVKTMDSNDEVYGIDWKPDSKVLAAASHHCMLRLWDTATGKPHGSFQESVDSIGYCVKWSPDGLWLAAGGGRMEPSVKIWNPHTGSLESTIIVPIDVIALAWSPDALILAAGLSNGTIYIIESRTWSTKGVLRGHQSQITGLDISYDGKFLISKADDDTVCLWDLHNWDKLAVLPEFGIHNRLLSGIAFHPKTYRLATLGDGGQSIRIWDLDRKKISEQIPNLPDRSSVNAMNDYVATPIPRKEKAGIYDVFLCHNSLDKPDVMRVGRRLRDRGIRPWLDEWDVRPGFSWIQEMNEQINDIKSAAVFVGKSGIGPWQRREVFAFLQQFVNRNCPVIPVILQDCIQVPELPILLADLRWVDFRKDEPDPMSVLIWGISGSREHLSY